MSSTKPKLSLVGGVATKIMDMVLARAKVRPSRSSAPTPTVDWARQLFKTATPPPGVMPDKLFATDEQQISTFTTWSAQAVMSGIWEEGLQFLGYPYLAALAQRSEYRKISERMAVEMTRKWIKLQATGEEDKSDKIKKLEAAMKRFKIKEHFRKLALLDGFFGRSHLYIDTGASDKRDELKTDIGDGSNKMSEAKIKVGDIKGFKVVEPVWAYPTNYNSNDPLQPDWYCPNEWFVMSKPIHASRFLTFIGREVPDLLKPAYSFGGLSISQMAKPYVDNWLRTRQSVSDLLHSFSVMVLSTDMSTQLQAGGDDLFKRIDLFNSLRDNRGLMIINKDTEEFSNVAAPISSLDHLQAQSQEQMAAVASIPLVILLGITPTGLNASSEGEIRVFYDWVASQQEVFFTDNLIKVLNFIQLNEFGEVDPELTFVYEPLWSLDAKTVADVKKVQADTDAVYLQNGVLNPIETRTRIAKADDSDYHGLDIEDVPALNEERGENEEDEGLAPRFLYKTTNTVGKEPGNEF